MMNSTQTHFNSLSTDMDILLIDVSYKGIKSLPDLTKFKKLKTLYCSNNQLTSLPNLPQNLQELYCNNNQLTSLPNLPQSLKLLVCSNNQFTILPALPQNLKSFYCSNNQFTSLPNLPQNLEVLHCFNNQLTSFPTLPQNLEVLDCSNNQLTILPTLPQNLEVLDCSNNQLTMLPVLPQKLEILNCSNNTIYEVVNDTYSLLQIKQNIQMLNNFRDLYYCLQFKKQFRKWLWEKVREPAIKKMYDPIYLIEKLGEQDDLDTFLENW